MKYITDVSDICAGSTFNPYFQQVSMYESIHPTNKVSIYYKFEILDLKWLRCCATNRKVAGSIPAGVSGFFIDIKSFRSHYGLGVDSASNINEYQEHFLGVKAAGA